MLEVIFPFSFKRTILGLTWLLLFSGGCVHDMMATHNRAGNHLQPCSRIDVRGGHHHLHEGKRLADRPWLYLTWGDEVAMGGQFVP